MGMNTTHEATTVREGKTYGYQQPQESAAANDVGERKHRLVMEIEAFLDSLTDQIRGIGDQVPPASSRPSAPAAPSATSAPSAATPSASSAPAYGAPGTGTGVAPAAPPATTAPSAPATTTTAPASPAYPSPGAGEQPVSTEASAATREALEVYSQREAYRIDRERTAARARQRESATGSAAVAAAPTVLVRTANKHQSDSNRSPLTQSREFGPAYGTKGANRTATMEKFSVMRNERPETTPAMGNVSTARPIDAYWASFGTPLERAAARAKADVQQMKLEVIIGTDDRVRVTNVQQYPWRCICSLLITAQTGTQYIGTGWLVAPRVVLTAGHCVYMADEGGWASQIEVMPGRDGTQRPYSAVSRDVRSVSGWTQDNDSDCDYGAILLPADKRFGDTLGWFGYAARDDDTLRSVTLNLAGYPGDGGKAPNQEDGTQWYMSRGVKDVMARQFSYEIDTFGGQSGSPVWQYTASGDRYGLGIHTWGTSVSNGATRITQEVFDNIVLWSGEAA